MQQLAILLCVTSLSTLLLAAPANDTDIPPVLPVDMVLGALNQTTPVPTNMTMIGWVAQETQKLDDIVWQLIVAPLKVIFDIYVWKISKLLDLFFMMIGYNSHKCRLQLICNFVSTMNAAIPQQIMSAISSQLATMLSLGSLTSDYFDAAFTGFMNFNCTNYYRDESCD